MYVARLWIAALVVASAPVRAETEEQRRPRSPLVAGHQLPAAPGLFVRFDAARSWGNVALVASLVHVGERMAWLMPDADPLLVGDMSRRGGGWLYGHRTHHLGVDADLGLYRTGRRQPRSGFADVRAADLDVEATWLLVRELLDTGHLHFALLDQSHIDVLRAYLLDEVGVGRRDVDAIFSPTRRPSGSQRALVRHAPNHRSHLHVRMSEAPPAERARSEP